MKKLFKNLTLLLAGTSLAHGMNKDFKDGRDENSKAMTLSRSSVKIGEKVNTVPIKKNVVYYGPGGHFDMLPVELLHKIIFEHTLTPQGKIDMTVLPISKGMELFLRKTTNSIKLRDKITDEGLGLLGGAPTFFRDPLVHNYALNLFNAAMMFTNAKFYAPLCSILYPLPDLPSLFSYVKELNINEGMFTDNSLSVLGISLNLTSLNMTNCDYIGDKSINKLSKLSKLKTLSLEGCERVDNPNFYGLRGLESLNLGGTDLGNKEWSDVKFSILTNLTYLNLNHCEHMHRLRNYGAETLVGLTSLDLSCTQIKGNEELRFFSKCTNLIKIDLNNCYSFNYASLLYLSKCTNLNELSLEYAGESNPHNSFPFSNFVNLTSLDLSGYVASDGKTLDFSKFTHLTKLMLGNERDKNVEFVKDEHLKQMSRLTYLSYLCLEGCVSITNHGFSHLSHLMNLTFLDLNGCFFELPDNDVSHLSNLTNLTTLNLSNHPDLSDNGLTHLKNLINLTDLELNYCYKITGNGIKLLSEKLPKLEL